MSAANLIERLDGVRQTAPDRWVARCPAHEDKRPSLSIRQTADGTWLLHDFAGCSALDICTAIGIEFRDLFPAGYIRRVEDREKPRLSARDALAALDHETRVVQIIAADFQQSREIDAEDFERLSLAASRIASARALCCPEGLR